MNGGDCTAVNDRDFTAVNDRDPVARTLGRRSWPEVAAMDGRAVLIVPVGSVEQHGPHLPLDTDTRVAVELSHRVARALASAGGGEDGRRPALSAVVAPAVAYGASGEHADFPGTLSVGTQVLRDLVIELVRSARSSFAAVVLVSGHGGNAEALGGAVVRCTSDGDRVLAAGAGLAGGDAHAGRSETSMMLAIDPCAVHLAAAEPGRTEPLEGLLADLRERGVRAVSPNGVLGDPTGANAPEGQRLLATATSRLAAAVERWWVPEGRR